MISILIQVAGFKCTFHWASIPTKSHSFQLNAHGTGSSKVLLKLSLLLPIHSHRSLALFFFSPQPSFPRTDTQLYYHSAIWPSTGRVIISGMLRAGGESRWRYQEREKERAKSVVKPPLCRRHFLAPRLSVRNRLLSTVDVIRVKVR